MEFRLKALTDIWTGGVNTRATENDRLRDISILGGIRWWYETLVRACDGWACDITATPKNKNRCELNLSQFDKEVKELKSKGGTQDDIVQKALEKQICYACQLFGCTNWSKKFLLRIKDKNVIPFIGPIEVRNEFTICFEEIKHFTEMERILLQQTIKLIVEYGSIGGRTVFKPLEDPTKQNKPWHKDFGILGYTNGFPIEKLGKQSLKGKDKNQSTLPNLNYFWFTKKDVNKFIGSKKYKEIYTTIEKQELQEMKALLKEDEEQNEKQKLSKWLQGSHLRGESKKIFSFSLGRCWGYARSEIERDSIIDKICSICGGKFTKNDLITGEKVLENEL